MKRAGGPAAITAIRANASNWSGRQKTPRGGRNGSIRRCSGGDLMTGAHARPKVRLVRGCRTRVGADALTIGSTHAAAARARIDRGTATHETIARVTPDRREMTVIVRTAGRPAIARLRTAAGPIDRVRTARGRSTAAIAPRVADLVTIARAMTVIVRTAGAPRGARSITAVVSTDQVAVVRGR